MLTQKMKRQTLLWWNDSGMWVRIQWKGPDEFSCAISASCSAAGSSAWSIASLREAVDHLGMFKGWCQQKCDRRSNMAVAGAGFINTASLDS